MTMTIPPPARLVVAVVVVFVAKGCNRLGNHTTEQVSKGLADWSVESGVFLVFPFCAFVVVALSSSSSFS